MPLSLLSFLLMLPKCATQVSLVWGGLNPLPPRRAWSYPSERPKGGLPE